MSASSRSAEHGEAARRYPKAVAPLSWAVLAASDARADRWMQRHRTVCAERDRLLAILDKHGIPAESRSEGGA